MKKKYRNRLPKGAKVQGYIAHIENGEIIVEVELKDKFLPKNGDFCISDTGMIFIFKSMEDLCNVSSYAGTNNYDRISERCIYSISNGRYATPKEKADFLERLETEKHLRWNSETKELEPTRWRAKFGENYFVVTNSKERNSFIVKEKRECSSCFDEENCQLNNYFRTPEAAQKVADQIINIFKNSKAE